MAAKHSARHRSRHSTADDRRKPPLRTRPPAGHSSAPAPARPPVRAALRPLASSARWPHAVRSSLPEKSWPRDQKEIANLTHAPPAPPPPAQPTPSTTDSPAAKPPHPARPTPKAARASTQGEPENRWSSWDIIIRRYLQITRFFIKTIKSKAGGHSSCEGLVWRQLLGRGRAARVGPHDVDVCLNDG